MFGTVPVFDKRSQVSTDVPNPRVIEWRFGQIGVKFKTLYIYIYIYSLRISHLRGDERFSDSSYEATRKLKRRWDRLASWCPISPRIIALNAHVALPTNRLTSLGHSPGVTPSLCWWLSTQRVHSSCSLFMWCNGDDISTFLHSAEIDQIS